MSVAVDAPKGKNCQIQRKKLNVSKDESIRFKGNCARGTSIIRSGPILLSSYQASIIIL